MKDAFHQDVIQKSPTRGPEYSFSSRLFRLLLITLCKLRYTEVNYGALLQLCDKLAIYMTLAPIHE
jgi:hypothetical protein